MIRQLRDRNDTEADLAEALVPQPLIKQVAGLVIGSTAAQDFLQAGLPDGVEANGRDQGLLDSERKAIEPAPEERPPRPNWRRGGIDARTKHWPALNESRWH